MIRGFWVVCCALLLQYYSVFIARDTFGFSVFNTNEKTQKNGYIKYHAYTPVWTRIRKLFNR